MTTKLNTILLTAIVLLGLFLRLYLQGIAPKGALVDETSFGYIAHSLAETGRDEHGVAWPMVFKAFGDNKLPLYGYTLIPFVQSLGLTELSIRLPSIISGTLLILAVYFLLRVLKFSKNLSLLGSFITAIAPWTFILSRFGLETNLALLFFTLGLTTLIKSTTNKHLFWPGISGFLFGLTWYTYVAYRPITLAILLAWLGYFLWAKLITKQKTIVAVAAFILTIIPITLFAPDASLTRLKQIGLFYSPGIPMEVIESRTFCTSRFPKPICYSLHNKGTIIVRDLTTRFFHTFSPQFLATTGGSEDFYGLKGYGVFYHVLYPLFILGIATLLFKKEGKDDHKRFFIASGTLISIAPGLLASDPQIVRYSALFPFLLIIIILGLKTFLDFAKNSTRSLILPALILILSLQAGTFFVYYFTTHSYKTDFAHQSFAPELMRFLAVQSNENTIINITPFFPDPLIYYAFYAKTDPSTYQQVAVLGKLEASGFQHTKEIGNVWAHDINFQVFSCLLEKQAKVGLYATNSKLADQPIIKTITSENGVLDYAYVYKATKQEDCDFHLDRYQGGL